MIKKLDNFVRNFDFLTFALCVYVIFMPLIPDELMVNGTKVKGDQILVVFFMIYSIRILRYKDTLMTCVNGIKKFYRDSILVFMGILFLSMIFSVKYARDSHLALTETFRFITYIAMYFIIKYEMKNKKALTKVINSYIFSCLLVSIFGIVQYFTKIGLDQKFIYNNNYSVGLRITSTIGNSNSLGAFLIVAIFPLIMISICEKSKVKKTFYILTTLTVIVTIILTFSRNTWIGFVLGLVLLIVMYNWRLIFLLLATGGVGFLLPSVRRRLLDFKELMHNDRVKLWKMAGKMIKDHPILGVGNGNYYTLYGEYGKKYPELWYNEHINFPSHNSYLKVQSELGIVGIVSFVMLIISTIIKIKQFSNRVSDKFYKYFYSGFFISVIVFLIMNISDNLFFVPKVCMYFWILIAIAQSIVHNKLDQ